MLRCMWVCLCVCVCVCVCALYDLRGRPICGGGATGMFSPAPGRGCAYTRVCVFPRSQNLFGVAGSSNFRRCAPVAREKQGPHQCRVVIIHLHPARPRD